MEKESSLTRKAFSAWCVQYHTHFMFDSLHGTCTILKPHIQFTPRYICNIPSSFISLHGIHLYGVTYSLHVPRVVEGGFDVPHFVRFEGAEESDAPTFFHIDHVPLCVLFELGTWGGQSKIGTT